MKKIIFFCLILVIIVSTIYYMYLNNIFIYKSAKKDNIGFEIYQNQEIKGNELASIINKVIDSNEKNKIQKDNDGMYIENTTNSIKMEINFLDNDTIYNIESIYNSGIENFIYYYGDINFKCEEIKYHDQTKKIKYMKFTQLVLN